MSECSKRGRFAPLEEVTLADVRMKVSGDRMAMSGEIDILKLNESIFPTELEQIDAGGNITR